MTSRSALDAAHGRQGGRTVPWVPLGPEFYNGQLVQVSPRAPFAPGQIVLVTQALQHARCRIAYGDVTDFIVPTEFLTPVQPTARAGDGYTSHGAAREQSKIKLTKARRLVLHALANAGDRGLTDFELGDVTGGKQTSHGVRRGELARAKLVSHLGETRLSDTGTPSKVWVITGLGLKVWRKYIQGAA